MVLSIGVGNVELRNSSHMARTKNRRGRREPFFVPGGTVDNTVRPLEKRLFEPINEDYKVYPRDEGRHDEARQTTTQGLQGSLCRLSQCITENPRHKISNRNPELWDPNHFFARSVPLRISRTLAGPGSSNTTGPAQPQVTKRVSRGGGRRWRPVVWGAGCSWGGCVYPKWQSSPSMMMLAGTPRTIDVGQRQIDVGQIDVERNTIHPRFRRRLGCGCDSRYKVVAAVGHQKSGNGSGGHFGLGVGNRRGKK